MFRRKSGQWYGEEAATPRQCSLCTRDERAAATKIHALCEAARNPLLNRDIGRIYLAGADPKLATRTWAEVMAVYGATGNRATVRQRAGIRLRRLRSIRSLPLNETRADPHGLDAYMSKSKRLKDTRSKAKGHSKWKSGQRP